MLTNFVDANGEKENDRCVFVSGDLDCVRVMKVESLLFDFGNLRNEDEGPMGQ